MHIILVDAKIARQLAEEIIHSPNLHSLRVAIEGDSVKFKINSGCWSPPFGMLDPFCEEAYYRTAKAKAEKVKSIDAMNETNRQEWEETHGNQG